MSLWQRISSIFEKRSMTDSQLYSLLVDGATTYAGPVVNESSAMRYGAVYACIRIISESIAALPLVLYQQSGRNKERATNHPLYPVLHNMANPDMTAFEWRELAISHVLAWGNHWSQIRTRNGKRELWPLNPARMETYEWRGTDLFWLYRESDDSLRAFPSADIHHIKGLGDGIWGNSPIGQAAKQAVGLGLATEEFGSRFFSNGAHLNKVLKHPGKLSAAAHQRLTESFAADHQGLSNAHRTKILEEGMDIVTLGIPPNEAQFLETRKFQIQEIARIYRVPPHMLADLDRATFSNIEQQSINFVIYTLTPWLVRHEQAIYRDLLNESERKNIFAKYIVEGMLRGDTLSRYQAHQIAVTNTILTPNEIRELEDRNPVEGGDVLFTPLNMMELGKEPPQPEPAPAPAQEGSQQEHLQEEQERAAIDDLETRARRTSADRRKIMRRNVQLWEDAGNRLVKREIADIRRAVPKFFGKRSAGDFQEWLHNFYEDLRASVPAYFQAIMGAYAEEILASVAVELGGEPTEMTDELREWITRYLENLAAVYTVGNDKQLQTILEEAETEEEAEAAILQRLEDWGVNAAVKLAFEQAFEAGNALAIFGYVAAGVAYLRWNASGDSCPLCQKMDGRRIPIGGSFFKEGDTLEADGVDPLPIVRKVKHGPLHRGCDCSVSAG